MINCNPAGSRDELGGPHGELVFVVVVVVVILFELIVVRTRSAAIAFAIFRGSRLVIS